MDPNLFFYIILLFLLNEGQRLLFQVEFLFTTLLGIVINITGHYLTGELLLICVTFIYIKQPIN